MKVDIKGYNSLDDIFYCIDPDNYEILWMNNFAIKELGQYEQGTKCYNFIFNRHKPCAHCQLHTLLNNSSKYLNKSIIRKLEEPIRNKKYMIKEKLIKEKGKLCKLSIIFDANKVVKSTSKIKQLKIMYENLLSTIADISLELDGAKAILQLLEGLQDMFKGTRCVFIKNQAIFLEVKQQGIKDYQLDNELIQLLDNNSEYLRILKENHYLYLHQKNINNPKLKEHFERKNIKSLIYLTWDLPFGSYRLMIKNSPLRSFNMQLFTTIHSIVYFMLRTVRYNEMLFQTSNIDALTGCYNRTYFNTVLSKYSQEIYHHVGVIFLDLDQLKMINDKFGHKIGDQNIVAISKILKKIFYEEEVFKIGGDEFVVVAHNQSFEAFNQKLSLLKKELELAKLACSYGVCYRVDNALLEEMIEEAEREMYVQKRHHHLDNINEEQIKKLANSIHSSIKQGHFICAIQPKINPYNNKIAGAEVLARGVANDGSIIYPNEFIPTFEKNNCIDILDYHMISEACQLLKRFKDNYNINLPISVNISRQTLFVPTFMEDLIKIYKKYDIPHHQLILEITEKSEVSLDGLLEICKKIHSKGFQFEMDDFGSYFTNLGFLIEKVFSGIKLDKSIVRKLSKDSLTKDVICYIIQKCHEQNIQVIFEGVETLENVELAKEIEVDIVQGFYYDKPLLEKDFLNKYFQDIYHAYNEKENK